MTISLLVALSLNTEAHAEATLHLLEARAGAITDGYQGFYTTAFGVSADGCSVVGGDVTNLLWWQADDQPAVVWSPSGASTTWVGPPYELPVRPGFNAVAWSTSPDGSDIYVHEFKDDSNDGVIFRDGVRSEVFEQHRIPGASADGSIIVGTRAPGVVSDDWGVAVRWIDGASETLPLPPGATGWSVGNGISADGSTIVGMAETAEGNQAVRWKLGNSTFLDALPGATNSFANAVSADGRVIVGYSDGQAVRWVDGVLEALGPGLAWAVSADGSTVVGEYFDRDVMSWPDAYIWTESEGWHRVADIIRDQLDAVGWSSEYALLSRALDISPDGRVIVGDTGGFQTGRFGRNPGDYIYAAAFAIYLDDSGCIPDTDADGVADSADNCSEQVNVSQFDGDGDGYGDACDACVSTPVGQAVDATGCSVVSVEIDIKPGSETNRIFPFGHLPIPVAILGSDTFDVADVDETTLAFGPGAAGPKDVFAWPLDLNGDGITDLLSFYKTNETGIALGEVEACLIGETLDGVPFEGCDSITTFAGCGLGFELAFLLPPLMWVYGRRRRAVH